MSATLHIATLREDHYFMANLLAQYDAARSTVDKQILAHAISQAFREHLPGEARLFEGGGAIHDALRVLAQLESSSPLDLYFDSGMRIFASLFEEHVAAFENARTERSGDHAARL